VSVADVTAPRRMLHPIALATVVAALAGAAVGTALAPDGGGSPPPDPGPRVGLTSGVARLPLPEGWQPLRRRSTLPGFGEATAVRGVHADVALDIRPPENASLLPAGVDAALHGHIPAPRQRDLGDRTAWRYDLPGSRPGTRLVAMVLPTTGGVVTIACQPGIGPTGGAGRQCERAIRSVQLKDATFLPPAPETAARIALPAIAARLNRDRRSGRRALAATRSPQGRSAAALALGRSYAAAAGRLRPLAAGDALRATATLDALAREHGALASASRRRDARAARAAGASIARDERRLAALLAALTAPSTAR
jgi:hypothetical protein